MHDQEGPQNGPSGSCRGKTVVRTRPVLSAGFAAESNRPGPPAELRIAELGATPTRRSLKEKTPAAAQQRSGQERERGTTMRIERRNTTAGQSPYAQIDFRLTTSEIRNPDGSVV